LIKDLLAPPPAAGNTEFLIMMLEDNVAALVALGEILADKEKNLPGNNPNSPG
jgi:hypothetical protein